MNLSITIPASFALPMCARQLRPSVRHVIVVLFLLLMGCGGGSSGDPVSPQAVSVTVTPASTTVNAGGTASFTASVTNATNSAVTWSASGGSISGSGASATWTAPLGGGPYTITATSQEDASKSASASVTVRPISVDISPSTTTVAAGGTQSLTATVSNTINTAVTWSTTGGTIAGTGATVTWAAPMVSGSYTVTAVSSADPTRTAVATITVSPIVITIAPATPTVSAGAAQLFTATVSAGEASAITWSASGGTITGSGATATWTAPTTAGNYSITATSTLDAAATRTVQATVIASAVTVTPTSSTLFRGESATFTAQVNGAPANSGTVVWTTTCGSGTVAGATFAYTAPGTPGTCTVTATSVADNTKSASATITVRAEWLVTSTDDMSDGTCNFAHCSLREALVAANAVSNPDVILLGAAAGGTAGEATVSKRSSGNARAVTGIITLTSALPTITTPITITGPGAAQLAIDAAASSVNQRRLFTIAGAIDVSISGLTLRNGRATQAGAISIEGGASVHLTNMVVSGNEALTSVAGAILVFGASRLETDNVVIENNRTHTNNGRGGAIMMANQGTLIMRGGSVRNNLSANRGGAIYAEGTAVTLIGVDVHNNRAELNAGGIYVWDGGSLTMTGGSIRENVATTGVGGGIVAGSEINIPAFRITMILTDVVIESNTAAYQGGGIQFSQNVGVTLERVIVRNNSLLGRAGSSSNAAGIFFGASVAATMNQSTVASNTVAMSSGDATGGGAGITIGGGFVTITNSTISGNTGPNQGGGVYQYGGSTSSITNSTISGNSGTVGGGIRVATATLMLRNVTVVGNSATVSGSGVAISGGTINVGNSLLANSVSSNCAMSGPGTITSVGFNISHDASCMTFGSQDFVNVAAGVNTTLANNGGPTLTHALLAGSVAINAGSPELCPATDQRGVARVGICDIGAFEYVPPAGSARRAFGFPDMSGARVFGETGRRGRTP